MVLRVDGDWCMVQPSEIENWLTDVDNLSKAYSQKSHGSAVDPPVRPASFLQP